MRTLRIGLVAACLLPLLAAAQDRAGLNTISQVVVRPGVVEIIGSRSPNFTTFTMASPHRLVIDVSDAEFKSVPAVIEGHAIVTGVKTVSYGSGPGAIARVLIGFEREIDTDIIAAGNTLRVKVLQPEAGARYFSDSRNTADIKKRDEKARETSAQTTRVAAAPIEPELRDTAAEKQARLKAEAEARRMGEEDARLRAEEDARRKAGEEAQRRAEAEAQRRAAEAEAQRRVAEAEAQRRVAEAEAQRRVAEAEAQRKAQAEAERRAAELEAQRRVAEAEAQRKAQAESERSAAELEAQRRVAEAEAQRKAQAESERRAVELEEQRRVAEAEAQRKAQAESARRAAELEAQRRVAEAEAQRKLQAEAERRAAELEAQRRAEAEAQRKAQAEAERRLAEAEARKVESEARRAEELEARRAREDAERDAQTSLQIQREERLRREEARRVEAEARRRSELEARRSRTEPAMARGGPRSVSLVGFRPSGRGARVSIEIDGSSEYEVREGDPRTVIVMLRGTRISSRNNARFLDTSFFDTPVQLVNPTEVGEDVQVTVKLKRPVPYQVHQSGHALVIEFQEQ